MVQLVGILRLLLNVAGEIWSKLGSLGILCTHVPVGVDLLASSAVQALGFRSWCSANTQLILAYRRVKENSLQVRRYHVSLPVIRPSSGINMITGQIG